MHIGDYALTKVLGNYKYRSCWTLRQSRTERKTRTLCSTRCGIVRVTTCITCTAKLVASISPKRDYVTSKTVPSYHSFTVVHHLSNSGMGTREFLKS